MQMGPGVGGGGGLKAVRACVRARVRELESSAVPALERDRRRPDTGVVFRGWVVGVRGGEKARTASLACLSSHAR